MADTSTQDTTQDDQERDAIVLPQYERQLTDAHAAADIDAITDTQAEYTKARAKALTAKRKREGKD